jgi:tetratricopeptide (TPR) repeat protein
MRSSSLVAAVILCALAAPAAQSTPENASPRLTALETWLAAVAQHRPGTLDEPIRRVNAWNQQQFRQIWIDVSTIVSLVREPGITLFYIDEPARGDAGLARQVSPLATTRSTQVLYTLGELKRLRELAAEISAKRKPGAENDILTRGAMLHADIEILTPLGSRPSGDRSRSGSAGTILFANDGRQVGLSTTISHWDMGRRLLDRVRSIESPTRRTAPDPGRDATVRQWYVASSAFMLHIRQIEPEHFARGLELFREDPEVLFLAASAHEVLSGIRTQSALRTMQGPRDVTFAVLTEGGELRLAEQLYRRALERNPALVEARIRLGQVLGRRGRHEEAVNVLRQGQASGEDLLQYYAHLFLGREFEALQNGPEARRSYERAAMLYPTAQSPMLGLSRVADRAGDRAAARAAVQRMLALPGAGELSDPWWVYDHAQARNVDQLLEALRQRFPDR